MPCCTKYADLAKEYVEHTRQRIKTDPWSSFLHGLSFTMTRRTQDHLEVVKDLKQRVPTLQEAREVCHIAGPYLASGKKLYAPELVREAICRNSREEAEVRYTKTGHISKPGDKPWSHLEQSMKSCNREGIREHYGFRQQKGPDMLLLESGCSRPVMDVWMLRRSTQTPRELWDDDEATRKLRRIQERPEQYAQQAQAMIDEAKECNVDVAEHHMACWLEMVFDDDRPAAQSYVKQLIGPPAVTKKTKAASPWL
ncbi:MAG: hypothetical protein QUS09_08725 [Methanotrichaceae archaeon]|nr:hypothetical protein [Methanotrichaceae archaeon]